MDTMFNKLICSTVAMISISSGAWGYTNPPMPFEQGYGLKPDQFPAAYNAPARFNVQNSWDLFLTTSFLYWEAEQDAMEIAINSTYTSSYLNPLNGSYVKQEVGYKPGFKIGMGIDCNFDDWVAFVEYTWVRQQTSTNRHTPVPPDSRGGTSLWQGTDWYCFLPTTGGTGAFPWASDFKTKWQTHIDLLDATLSRPFYRGRQITVTPFGGLRGAWIRQNFRMSMTDFLGVPITPVAWPVVSHNHSNSWAVGPRFGLSSHYLMGAGFRLEGDVAGSLLYTRYTTISHREDSAADFGFSSSFQATDYDVLRPMADLKLGLGWGAYSDHQNYHFDLLASYDFNMLWSQNMMRSLVNDGFLNFTSAPGDLHLQGLNVTARLDF